jgi:glycosyltransferase involved in cell wall biosynthesis
MIVYFTFNDASSGIFSSQVIDVVKYLRTVSEENIRLLSIISIRNFFINRKKIKDELNDAIVLPMFPGVQNWKWNVYILYIYNILYKPRVIISRGVFACNLSLKLKTKKNKVIYDGRGAISAEWNEYMIGNIKLQNSIYNIEKKAVLNSDYRISVSQKLVKYWSDEFGYNLNNHLVIPCTLNTQYESLSFNLSESHEVRNELGFDSNDIIFVYSGSNAGWQSFDILKDYLENLLINNERHKVLFLSGTNCQINELILKFPNRIKSLHVDAKLVPKYLMACDYGLLIREESITNSVASPVKFAEYLACGLPVIISENLGDYSEFAIKYKAGFLYPEFNIANQINLQTKRELANLALMYFSKNSYKFQYCELLKIG